MKYRNEKRETMKHRNENQKTKIVNSYLHNNMYAVCLTTIKGNKHEYT